MTEIKFSPLAIEDLIETKAYISHELYDEKAAAETIAKIIKHIRQLREFPLSGSPLSSVITLQTDYRLLVCGNYKAFYRLENNTVYIVRILYGRRDFMRILFTDSQEQ